MPISTLDCWRMIIQSRLLTKQQCQQLSAQYGREQGGADDALAKPLVKWLIAKNVISRYQGSLLLAGQAGPFYYGNYKIYDRFEQGRLAGLFRAVHAPTNHPVVLWFATGRLAQDQGLWSERARRLPQLEHPNVARCYEAVDAGGYRFFVLEDLRGVTAEEYLIDKGKMPAVDACRVVYRVAQALAFLHAESFTHGDIRPANLWFEPGGDVKLLIDPHAEVGPLNLAAGQLEALADRADYLAPELAQAGRRPSPLTDIYALGCTLFELCLGKPPFAGGTVEQKLKRHASEPIKALPKPLGEIIAYMMAKKAEVRFQEAAMVADRLEPLAVRATKPIEPTPEAPTARAYETVLLQQAAEGPAPSAAAVEPTSPSPQVLPAAAPSTVTAQPAQPVPVASSRSAVAERIAKAKARRRRNTILTAMGMLVLIGAIAAGLHALNQSSVSEPVVQQPVVSPPLVSGEGTPEGDGEDDQGPQVVPDDGKLLWASPTDGEAIDLSYLPGGAQVFLVARLAELLESEEGRRVMKALGPDFESQYEQWAQAAGVPPEDIEQLIMGLYANEGQFPEVAMVVRLKEPASPGDLLEKWRQPAAVEDNGKTYYRGTDWSYLVPDEAEGRVFVMGHEAAIEDLAGSETKTPLLRREVGTLLRSSDVQRHVTLLFAPSFLFGDGRAMFAGERQKIMRPLEAFLGDGLKAGMFSAHFADHLTYLEMKMESDIVDDYTVAANMRDRLARLPDTIESYIASLTPHPYWRLVAIRYPAMVRSLHRQTRVGVADDLAMMNAALPPYAAHNLVFGGEMALASAPGPAIAVAAAPAAAQGPKTVEEVLQTKLSVSFDQDSLEFAVQNIENEVTSNLKNLPFPFKIRIIGDDLELDGITRNQQIRDFRHEEKTVAEILTALVRKANPVTTVQSPSEPDQKLLWVIGPDPDNPADKVVLITTRQVAEKKYELPAVFRTP